MSKKPNKFLESFLDRNNKVDHKRLTVFAFTVMFLLTTVVALFRQKEITNSQLVETILYVQASVIIGGMGFSMINKPTQNVSSNTTEQELLSGGDAP